EMIEDIELETTFTNVYFDVGRRFTWMPTPLGFEIAPLLGVGWGKLTSPTHIDSDRVLNLRPGVRLMRVLHATDSISIVLSVDARYTYSRTLEFAGQMDNYRAPVVLFELGFR